MADTAPDTKPDDKPAPPPSVGGGLNLQALVDQAAAGPPPELVSNLKDITARESAEREAYGSKMIRDSRAQLAEAERARKAEAASVNDIKPWNAQEEAKKYTTDPLEAFGSLGSVFALMASAFTHQPMVNALNGSAAAMNAIRERDQLGYNRAFDAWKSNIDLAVKRHSMMHQDYEDALQLMTKNMELGQAQLRIMAAKYQDRKTLAYLDAGMDKELLDLVKSRNETAFKLLQLAPRLDEFDMKQRMLLNDPDWNSGDPKRMQVAKQRAESKLTPQQDAYFSGLDDIRRKENREPNSEERTGLIKEIFPRFNASSHTEGARIDSLAGEYEKDPNSPTYGNHNASMLRAIEEIKKAARKPDTSPNAEITRRAAKYEAEGSSREEAYDRANREVHEATLVARNSQNAEIQRRTKMYQQEPYKLDANAAYDRASEEVKLASSPTTLSAEIMRRTKQYETEEGSPSKGDHKASFERASQDVRGSQTVVSGNRADALRGMADRADMSTKTIDDLESMLKQNGAITGLGGKITRPTEVVENWFGSNATVRHDFERKLNLLREWAPRLLQESTSRPLSAEEGKIAKIVPGLELGATTQNVTTALNDLKQLLKTMASQWRSRAQNAYKPVGSETEPTKSFEDFPAVQ